MKRAWNAFWDRIAVALETDVIERRSALTIAQAIEVDAQNAELMAVTGSAEVAAEMRGIAIDAAKCGMTGETAEKAFRQWMEHPNRTYYELMRIHNSITERMKRYE